MLIYQCSWGFFCFRKTKIFGALFTVLVHLLVHLVLTESRGTVLPSVKDISFVFQTVLRVIMLADRLRRISKHLRCHNHISSGLVDDFRDCVPAKRMGAAHTFFVDWNVQPGAHSAEKLVYRIIGDASVLRVRRKQEGTGGIRKVRFPLKNRGKSGSVRVCYTDFEEYEVTYLITAFTKSEQENLTDAEKNVLKKLVKALKEEAAKNRRR